MTKAEIDEIRKDTIMSRDYLESANLDTIYLNDVIRNLCDELEKAQAVVERVNALALDFVMNGLPGVAERIKAALDGKE